MPVSLETVKVTRQVAEALDKQSKDDWSKQFNLISHCSSFSGNGYLMKNDYQKEFEVLNTLSPLEYAKCLLIGYEVVE